MAAGDQTTPAGDRATPPIPPRSGACKRTLAGMVLGLAVLGCLRWAWGCEAERRLQARIDAYRAAGEPVEVRDIIPRVAPERANAAVLYREAEQVRLEVEARRSKQFYGDPTRRDYCISDAYEQLTEGDTEPELAELVDDYDQVLWLLRKARERPECQWGVTLSSPLIKMKGTLILSRRFVKLACVAAWQRHHQGNDQAAVESLRDGLALAERARGKYPGVIPLLIADACTINVVTAIERITPELRVVDTFRPLRGTPSWWEDMPWRALRKDVVALIAALLDVRPLPEALQAAIHSSRVWTLDTAAAICEGQVSCRRVPLTAKSWPPGSPAAWEAPLRWALRPLWKLDAVEMLDAATEVADAASAATWPEAKRLTREELPEVRGRLEWLTRSWDVPEPRWGPLKFELRRHYRSIAVRRMAATALALRLYELDHGEPAAELADLVPDYLPEVPADPFASGNQPLRYAPDGVQPLLYSVGPNGVDDGGKLGKRGLHCEGGDFPFSLDGRPPSE